ncbi:MAG TPA: PadR family transcriptional regulator [Acidimicrobiales bacterium]|nr:PadR family transcriptional regulator [Acidimicrobiales bacterium]
MSRGSLTTTSYAVLGLLAIKPWRTYELTRQMDRSLGRIWPRAVSKLYEEPKKLVAHGLAEASEERFGRRRRTVYAITHQGRAALAAWLAEPGAGPVLESEQLLKVFFSEHGTRDDVLATLAAAGEWARARSAESAAIGRQYLEGRGPFPERGPQLDLTARFLTDFYALVGEWARWATAIVETWPDDGAPAQGDPRITEDIVRRATEAAGLAGTQGCEVESL